MEYHGLFLKGKTYLVSYPRSGANWLRYCIEYITNQPTLGVRPDLSNPLTPLDNSVSWATNKLLGEDFKNIEMEDKVILQHSHRWFTSSGETRILFLIRNYKEAILRDLRGTLGDDDHLKRAIGQNPLHGLITPDGIADYAHLAKRYAEHHGDKHIVYYEDFKDSPEKTLQSCTSFLMKKDTTKEVENFMKEFDYHNSRSVKLYSSGVAKSYTGETKNKTLHSDEFLSDSDKKRWDKYIIKNHPMIVPIVERYFEK